MARFKPGESGNPSGRPTGSKNKHTREIKEIIESRVDFEEIIDKLAQKAKQGREGAAKLLLEYAYGKPLSREEVSIQQQSSVDTEDVAAKAQASLKRLRIIQN